MKRTLLPLLGLFLAGTLTACGANRDLAESPGPSTFEEARIAVTNNNWLDMSIYAVSGGRRHRLGMVNTMNTKRFVLPKTFVSAASTLYLVADPIGASGSYVTEAVDIWPGETVELTIQNLIGTSAVSIQ